MTPAAWRALADRVEMEEPSRRLDAEIFTYAIQTRTGHEKRLVNDHIRQWCGMNGRTDLTADDYMRAWAPHYTSAIDDAAALMLPGWRVTVEQHSDHWSASAFYRGDEKPMGREQGIAPTEEPARTALACRVQAVVMEANNAD